MQKWAIIVPRSCISCLIDGGNACDEKGCTTRQTRSSQSAGGHADGGTGMRRSLPGNGIGILPEVGTAGTAAS